MDRCIMLFKETISKYIVSQEMSEITAVSFTKYCPEIFELIPAHGCEFACEYCFVDRMHDGKRIHPITVFEKYPDIVEKTIDEHRAKKIEAVYYLSPKTDIFQRALIETKITHRILSVMAKKGVTFFICTKGKLPDNEILELLIKAGNKTRVLISYGLKNEEHANILEPNAATLEERYEFAKICTKYSIPAMGVIEPILPLNDLSFVNDIMERFVDIGIDHFAIDFARLSNVCLERLIKSLPELEELKEIYYDEKAIRQESETGTYSDYKIVRYSPSHEYLSKNYHLINNYAQQLGATISVCNYFKVPGINLRAYKRGFLCFGIQNQKQAEIFLNEEKGMLKN